jgi:O-antigen ligase
MFQNSKHVITISKNPDNWILAIVFLIPAFFLVLKSVATTGLFLVFFISCWAISKEPQKYLAKRGTRFWVMIVCLLSPFLAELLAQFGRGSFMPSSLDGPSRAILAAVAFIYFSHRNCNNLVSALSIGSGAGIVLLFLYVQIFPEYYWGNRAATHFVDPITLPCYAFVLMGLYLFGDSSRITANVSNFVKLLIFVLTVYIAIESQSRSAWVAGIVLAKVYLLYAFRASFVKQILAVLVLVLGVFAIFNFSDIFRVRSIEAYGGLVSFLEAGGGQASSSGQRMILLLIDFELIKENLFFGVADGVMPTFEYLKVLVPSLNAEIYEIKTLAGSHSEMSGQLVRKGLFLGIFVLWGFFIYPLYLIIRDYMAQKFLSCASQTLLGLVVPVLISGLTIQVFNLKMTISFYVLSLAVLLASYYREHELTKPGKL